MAIQLTDQLANIISLSAYPKRIISLVPSQTELLYDLGLHEEVIGITKFCVHPKHWLASKTIVGGTKNFHFDTIDKLNPDLIIGNKEENYKEGIERLAQKYPVWMSDIYNLTDALEMIISLGKLTDRKIKAKTLVDDIRGQFSVIKKFSALRVLYLIWRNPWMAAGHNTFIHWMIENAGLINCIADRPRYPELSSEEIFRLKPDIVMLSSEPYPFREKHAQELQMMSPSSKIILVDGEMFSWYGSRLAKAPAYLNGLGLN